MAFDVVSCGKRSGPFMIICRKSRQQLPVDFKIILKDDLGQIRGPVVAAKSHVMWA